MNQMEELKEIDYLRTYKKYAESKLKQCKEKILCLKEELRLARLCVLTGELVFEDIYSED